MLFVVAAFAATFLIISGAYWLLVDRPEAHAEEALRQRLVASAHPGTVVPPPVLRPAEPLSAVTPIAALLRPLSILLAPVRRLIDRSARHVTLGAVVLAAVFAALVASFAVSFLHPSLWLRGGAAVAGAAVPFLYLQHVARARVAAFEQRFPEAIDLVARSLRAGHALTTALELVGSEASEPVASEFRLLFERQNFGLSLEDAMRAFAERVPLVDARFFVTAVLTQREVGGNLSEVLDSLAAVIRERFTVKRQIHVVSTHGRITGWVLGLLPFAIAVAILVTSPSHLELLYRDPVGIQLAVGALVLQVIGVLFIRRIINVEY